MQKVIIYLVVFLNYIIPPCLAFLQRSTQEITNCHVIFEKTHNNYNKLQILNSHFSIEKYSLHMWFVNLFLKSHG